MSADIISLDPRGVRSAVESYIGRGFRAVRIDAGTKGPKSDDWGMQAWGPADFSPTSNVGLQVGPCAAGNLVNIDGDCPEAVALMPLFLPTTTMISGRPGRGPAHPWYLTDDALPFEKFLDTKDGANKRKTLIEFRSTDGTKQLQTLAPPSIHPDSGEEYRWYSDGEPTRVSAKILLRAVRAIAGGALLIRHFPASGRHELALSLAGALLRAGWPEETAHDFIMHVYEIGGSDKPVERAAVVRSTAEKLAKNEQVTGIPRMTQILGRDIVNKLVEWLGLKRDPVTSFTVVDGHPLRPNSYLTAVTIVEKNIGDVLDGRKLEQNSMRGCPELGRVPLLDVDVTRIRAEIERRVEGGKDRRGNPVPMTLTLGDVHNAVLQIANNSTYHPVADYLRSLKWDGVSRFAQLPTMFGAADTPLNRIILSRWFIGAVARPIKPGCKQDVMLVLIGEQGVRKSTAFRVLASDQWFCDSAIDIHSKDAYLTLRKAWILEWAELESLQRARDAGAVKSFLTSSVDSYRPSYGRLDISVPRSGVIVGSTNDPEFLADETGSRRFWPLSVKRIDTNAIAQARDQLWAEAVYWFDAGEPWWLSEQEDALIAPIHEEHAVSDAWTERMLSWVEDPKASRPMFGAPGAATDALKVTTANILEHALGKERQAWSRADENRVGKIMRRAKWKSKRLHDGPRIWVKEGGEK